MTPLEFLKLLWGNKPDALFLLIWVLHGKKSHWFQQIDGAASFIENGHSRDVYVGVGLSPTANGENQRCKSENVAGITGLWADFDLSSAAHPKALPRTIEEALKIIPTDLPPTIVVSSGNGVHVWWLFEKPWVLRSDSERDDAATLSTRFQTLLQYHSRQRGWVFDRLGDLARVLRIPGTINAKDPATPKVVDVYSVEGRRYTPGQIREYLDRAAIPGQDVDQHVKERLEPCFSDSPLIINLHAAIPDQQIEAWCTGDPRFCMTWRHERDDLRDQSGSGYDLALASFGVHAALSDQQIVDLIIHHRRIHGERRRTRLDYFKRTISKARGPEPAECGLPQSGQKGHNQNCADVAADDVIQKAQLCEQLSSLFGVSILRLLKIPGSSPVYLMELENGRIEFDIARLTTQRSVKLAFAGRVGRIIPTFKNRQWLEITQMLLDACTVVDATDDLEFDGAARIQLERYLSDNPILPDVAQASRRDILKPVLFRGQVTVHTIDWHSYLSQTSKLNAPIPRLAAMLTSIGAREIRIREGAYGDQSRWVLPVDQFPPRDYIEADPEEDIDAA